MRNALIALVAGLGLALSASAAQAGDFDFSGTFQNDNDVVGLNFSVAGPSDITIFSSSWKSGDSGLGFDPILAIWDLDAGGTLVQQQDDGGNTGATFSNGVLYTHGTWDTYFQTSLGAGNYLATIAQYDNFANGSTLAAGFNYDGNPNFTFDEGYGSQPLFNGVWSSTDARTGNWEFHILDVDTAAAVVPLPPAALMGLGLLGGLGLLRRLYRRK